MQNETWTAPLAQGLEYISDDYCLLNRNTSWNNHNRKDLCLLYITFSNSFIVLHSMGSNQKAVYMRMQKVLMKSVELFSMPSLSAKDHW